MAEPEKKTAMVLKVDLQCHRCCKKIQKILCRIPQIRDRVFDEKANTVTITVICCSPEKIRDKLCSKGGKIIKSIEIKEPPMPKPEEPENRKEPGKPKEQRKAESNGNGNEPPLAAPKRKPPENPAPGPRPVGLPSVYPVNPCCGLCYEGYGGGPCYHNYGFPPPPRQPQPCYDGNYARGPGYVYGRPPCCVTRRCDYFSEENTTGYSDDSSSPVNGTKTESHSPSRSGGSTGSRVAIICLVLVTVVLLSFFLFKFWQKKKREDQYARLLKLFEEDDELELELGLRD